MLQTRPIAAAAADTECDDAGGRGPEHVGVIMDGNGRWATRRSLQRIAGHKKGVETVRNIVKACPGLGVRYLTLYAFSTENWKRSRAEVEGIMNLFRLYIRREAAELQREGVRVRFLGDRSGLSEDLVDLMDGLERKTRDCARLHLSIAINYGGRAEIAQAARALALRVASGEIAPEDITENTLGAALYTHDLPDPDLIIRTSGEMRTSNFLTWQSAYSELVFVDECWPDFTAQSFARAIGAYGDRERRFGAAAG